MPRPLCQHCQKRAASRPRQLCWTCYYNHGVRKRYASGTRGASRGIEDRCGGYRLPEAACGEPPGSDGKVEEMMRRARAGVSLWHPEDRRRETT